MSISDKAVITVDINQQKLEALKDAFSSTSYAKIALNISKNIIKPAEWDDIVGGIYFIYQHDNYFEELKRQEIFSEKISQLQNIDPFKGTYFSRDWIAKNVLGFTEEEWEKMKADMKKEGDTGDDMDFDMGDSSTVEPKPKPKKDPDAVEDGKESQE